MPEHFERIFLLSHMRACTSLAGHILGSHPAINGYFEMHISYADATALDRQRAMYLQYESFKPGSRYLFDKLLHNDYRLEIDRLGDVGIRLLVALLDPEQAIRSIVDLFASKQTAHRYAAPLEAGRYYVERLQWLADFCRNTGHPYYYYDAELFRTAPARLLGAMTGWLELDTPLSERYQLFSQTGKPGRGDSSALIGSGRIEQVPVDYSHILLPEQVLEQATQAYRDCRALLIGHAADALTVP